MIVVVDYGLGNLFSVAKALEMVGADVLISGKPDDLRRASHIVLPGVGAFGDGMDNLNKAGLSSVLTEEVVKNKKPFLGICLGLQLLGSVGYEYGEHRGLGWIKGEVKKLDAERFGLKVPHIGWNNLTVKKETPLFRGIRSDADFYFVHSYQLYPSDNNEVVATSFYGEEITAAVHSGNIFAVQFHPEKSQENGLKLLENFTKIC